MQRYDHYLPGLHGIRAIAAILVMIAHINSGFEDFGLNYFKDLFTTKTEGIGVPHGCHEVTIFFTLSGFLITYLLLREKAGGAISIRKFYMRRILRIWPLYYLYLLIALLTYLVFNEPYDHSLLPYYIFMAANVPMIINAVIPVLTHFWSLAVEEHFYILFPHLGKFSIKNLLFILTGLTLLILVLKLALVYAHGIHLPYSIYLVISVYRPQAFLIGALGGLLYFQNNRAFISLCTAKVTQVICWLVIALLIIEKFYPVSFFKDDIIPFVSVCLIIGQVVKRNRIFNLERPVLNYLGKISFGIYVIHPLVLYVTEKITGRIQSPSFTEYAGIYGIVCAVTIFLAHLSYFYYERYFLRLKTDFRPVMN